MQISEIFGPTIQGEGPSCGQLATFVRTWGCNLDCAWCDTPYTWDVKGKNGVIYLRSDECTEMSVEDIASQISTNLVVITGGEPLLQANFLQELFMLLPGHRFEIETNGTLKPFFWQNLRYNVSPKLSTAKASKNRLDNLRYYRDLDSIFKFVATSRSDIEEIKKIVDMAEIDNSLVWVMPEGTSRDKIISLQSGLVDDVIEAGFNLSTRLHVLLWENKRGV